MRDKAAELAGLAELAELAELGTPEPESGEVREDKILDMERAVRLSYCYHDIDVVELDASAWNGSFGGSTRLWVAQGKLSEIADSLVGFPANSCDTRGVTLGAFGPEFAGGAMYLGFSCIDSAGHCKVEINVEADFNREPTTERAELAGFFEPAALDRFVDELRER